MGTRAKKGAADGGDASTVSDRDPDVTALVATLRSLAAEGVIDRAHMVRVGGIEVHLGPADLPAELAKGDPDDPKVRIRRMVYQLGIKGSE